MIRPSLCYTYDPKLVNRYIRARLSGTLAATPGVKGKFYTSIEEEEDMNIQWKLMSGYVRRSRKGHILTGPNGITNGACAIRRHGEKIKEQRWRPRALMDD